jgi:putative membrane protein
LQKHELYPVQDYGSEVAPFYIVLSMWVGAVITAVMLKPGQATGTKYTPIEMYFGKLLIFIIMSLLQATVTLIGCFILGIEVSNPLFFVLSAYLISAVFMLICYSLISALGQVGKAISVILLVLQISGTGGIYPIEIMTRFFKALYPYLPMTHAITLIRESALGLLWSSYMPALIYMVGLGIGTVIVAAVVKQFADKGAHWFDEKLKETNLFG